MKSTSLPLTAAAVALFFGLTSGEPVFASARGEMPAQALAAFNAANVRLGIRAPDGQATTAPAVRAFLGAPADAEIYGLPSEYSEPLAARFTDRMSRPQARADDGGGINPTSIAEMDDDGLQTNVDRFKALIGVINEDASSQDRDLTTREERRLDAAEETLAMLRAEATSRRPAGRKTNAELREGDQTTRAQAATKPRDRPFASPRASDPGKGGFGSVGEYLAAVIQSSAKGASPDQRLFFNAAPSSFGSEGVGADGGFAVPPDFRTTIMQKLLGETSLLSLTDQQTSSSNTLVLPTDETTPWQSSGGIQAYWEAEGGQKQQSKPALTEKTVKLNKIIALVPLTDELLEDSPSMAGYVNTKAPQKMLFKINDAILNGTGVGMPIGILNSPGTVVVPKEGGQAADTVTFTNLTRLWSAITPTGRLNARWLLHPDVESQLLTLQFPGTGTAVPAYMPPTGLAAAPFGSLFGRPIIYTEAAQALGNQGDIVFGDLSNYLSAVKTGGIKSDVSIHLWFDYDITAFRFVLRVGGQPWWNAPIQPFQTGSTTRGFFATLAARS